MTVFVRSLSATLAASNSRRLYTFACALRCHLLGASPNVASSLSPFPPASHLRLPRARKRAMLSLFHLKGRSFTCLDTQFWFLSVRLSDFHLSSPPYFRTVSSKRIAPQNVRPTHVTWFQDWRPLLRPESLRACLIIPTDAPLSF